LTIEPNSLLINYTDGLSEAANNDGEQFEMERLVAFIQQNNELSVSDFNTKLVDKVIAFKQDTDFDDDITLLSVRFR
jgi:sigma-B regulation protein RsbU (phosphoserine phosphatase)